MTTYNLQNHGEVTLNNNELIERAINEVVKQEITTKSNIKTCFVIGWTVYIIEYNGFVHQSKNIDRSYSEINQSFGHIGRFALNERIEEFKQAMIIFHNVTSFDLSHF